MKTSKYIKILLIIMLALISILLFSNNVYGKNLDEIENYEITISPSKKDGSLDILYKITWKVLDSKSEGPLSWVKIGVPNEHFSNLSKVEGNIKSIAKYGSEYVRIDFNRSYNEGEELTFSYKFHQTNMYTISGDNVEYTFWPAWFDSLEIKNLKIQWDGIGVSDSDSSTKDGKYLIWHDSNMKNGKVFKINVTYPVSYFTKINTSSDSQLDRSIIPTGIAKSINSSGFDFRIIIFIVGMAFFLIFAGTLMGGSGRSYYGHSGFYDDDYDRGFWGSSYDRNHYSSYHSSCVSSCACASSCASSCACACAGSGRAGCSLKDFYGTNITTEKLKKAFEKK